MKKLLTLVLAVMVVFTVGCGKVKLDGSSSDALKASMEKMQDSLSEEQKEKFADAMGLIITDYAMEEAGKAFAMAMSGQKATESEEQIKARMEKEMLAMFNGKTYDDIIKKGDELQKKYEDMYGNLDEEELEGEYAF
ncbi:hypothetical protein Dip510_000525 [Elusimicrobium posterum]|uniref:DUF6694 family lipoprotein n=1 Tax=Elusimicrobium posterum TaxID=3116653 RepID=UPI003C712817